MIYDLRPLIFAMGIIDEFNALKLEELEFSLNGEVIKSPAGSIEEWKYVGLNNLTYVREVLLPNKPKE